MVASRCEIELIDAQIVLAYFDKVVIDEKQKVLRSGQGHVLIYKIDLHGGRHGLHVIAILGSN